VSPIGGAGVGEKAGGEDGRESRRSLNLCLIQNRNSRALGWLVASAAMSGRKLKLNPQSGIEA
jgi:hypothetical protein